MNNINISYRTIFIFFLLFLFLLLILVVINKIYHIEEDTIQLPRVEKGNLLKQCKRGCIRGRCNVKGIDSTCKHDIECHECQDDQTQMNYRFFDRIYTHEEQKQNKQILQNNQYIHLLNNKIQQYNDQIHHTLSQ